MITCCIICNLIGYTLVCETLPTQRRGLILGTLEIVICLGQLQNIVIMMFTHKNLEDGNISAFLIIMIIIMILTSIIIYMCIDESPRFLFFQDLYQEDFELKELINAEHKSNNLSSCEKNNEHQPIELIHEHDNKLKLLQTDQNQLVLFENKKTLSFLKPYHILLLKIISQNKSSYTLTNSTIIELEKWGHKIQKDEINSEVGGNSWSPLFHGKYLTTTKVNKFIFCKSLIRLLCYTYIYIIEY